MIDSLISTFVVERNKLTDEDVEKIQSYCKSLNNTERWEVEISTKNGLVSGCCFGLDVGCFYLFLVGNKLDKIIDIVRG